MDAKLVDKMCVTPHKVAAMRGRWITKVVMGPTALHGVILTKQGTAFSFGRNESGQLGLGDEKTRSFPRMIQNMADKIIDAACGARHTLLLGASGKVYTCGKNNSGQLGVGDAKMDHMNMPRVIPYDFGKAIQVQAGKEFSMVLNDAGQIFAFGHPEHGCLGNGTDGQYFDGPKLTFHYQRKPRMVEEYVEKEAGKLGEGREKSEETLLAPPKIVNIQCGPDHTIALAEDGNVFTWGFGGYGRLGHDSVDDEHKPRLNEYFKPSNPNTEGAKEIRAGGSCCIAITRAQGHPFFWGQLKTSGEANMYPKKYNEMMGDALEKFDIGMKHVVTATVGMPYALGSSPCYGELGLGEGELSRSTTAFKAMAPIANVPIIDIACGYAQTLLVADISTAAARKDIYELPSLGTVTDNQAVQDLADQALDSIGSDQVVMLDNIKNIVEVLEVADEDTLKKAKKQVGDLKKVVSKAFASLSAEFAKGEFVPTGVEVDEAQLEDATEYIKTLVAEHGTDADEIAAAVIGQIEEAIEA